ncbi:MAG: hypothetical protein ABUS57_02320 [Pseudomonadota bacterium]
MQLSFDLAGVTPLAEARDRLLTRFGPQRDARRRDPVSQLILSIVSSQTYDAVSSAAFARLKLKYRDWAVLKRAPEDEVRALIADVTYAEKKAPALLAALNRLHAQKGALTLDFLAALSSDDAMAWLERLHGVGRKIAAAVVNFSSLRGYAFVIDTHVLRVAQRLAWVSPRAKTAEKAYAPLMALMPPAWDADDLYELHWLMKRLGQTVCTYAEPDCGQCSLRDLCAYASPHQPPEPPHDETSLETAEIISNDNNADLKAQIAKLEHGELRMDWGVLPFDDARVDACLPGSGLPLGRLHEIGGEGLERETPAAVTGFTAALAARTLRGGVLLWTLQRDDLYAPGLQAFGVDPDRLILVRVDKDDQALSVVEDATRTRGVSAVVGEVSSLDLTAGRRLQLVCEHSGATAFMLRRQLYAAPRIRNRRDEISSAATRWRIAPAPSETEEPGLGPARWAARLERSRGGRTGAWIMEMQNAEAARAVRVVAELADHAPAADHGRPEHQQRARHRDHGGERAMLGGG